jgi:hypothetical protein
MNLRTFLISAAHPATVQRAWLTCLIVGTVLTAINHGPALIAGQLTAQRIFQILLTFVVPYSVSTVSSVLTRSEMKSARSSPKRHNETLCRAANTVISDTVTV